MIAGAERQRWGERSSAGRRDAPPAQVPAHAAVLALQRSAGNRAVGGLIAARRQAARPAPPVTVQRVADGDGAGEPAGGYAPLPAPDLGARISAEAGGGDALDADAMDDLAALLGADLSAVRVHTGPKADRLARAVGATAFTAGPDIFFRAGRYDPGSREGRRLLAHEVAHTVQQAAGPVAGTPAVGGVAVSHPDDSFEREARAAGDRALDGAEPARTPADAVPSPAPAARAGPVAVQRDLGFELETQALVDEDGRPIPEKTDLGRYGSHLMLTVDESPGLSTATPQPSPLTKTADDLVRHQDTRAVQSYSDFATGYGVTDDQMEAIGKAHEDWERLAAGATWTYLTAGPNQGHVKTLDELVAIYPAHDATTLPGILAMPTSGWKLNTLPRYRPKTGNPVGLKPGRMPRQLGLVGVSSAVFDTVFVDFERLEHPSYEERATGDLLTADELGGREGLSGEDMESEVTRRHLTEDEYASILEIVTDHYPPETDDGRTKLREAIAEARELAGKLGAILPNRVALKDVDGVAAKSDTYNVGNPAQPKQSVDASIQATFGLDLAQLPAYVRSSILGEGGGQSVYKLKHHSDTVGQDAKGAEHDEGDRVREAMTGAVSAADEAIADQPGGIPAALPHIRGLLVLAAQYLLLGRHFVDSAGKAGLDKNIVALMSRTDLSKVRDLLPLGEQMWLSPCSDDLIVSLLAKTGRTGASSLRTDETETETIDGQTCEEFLEGVLTGPDDTLTATFGAIKMMGPESTDPGNRPARQGPVFELRNIVPEKAGVGGVDRFIPATWKRFAESQIELLAELNVRDPTVQDVPAHAPAAGPPPARIAGAGPPPALAAGPPMPKGAAPAGLSFTEELKRMRGQKLKATETRVTTSSGSSFADSRPVGPSGLELAAQEEQAEREAREREAREASEAREKAEARTSVLASLRARVAEFRASRATGLEGTPATARLGRPLRVMIDALAALVGDFAAGRDESSATDALDQAWKEFQDAYVAALLYAPAQQSGGVMAMKALAERLRVVFGIGVKLLAA